MQTNMLLFRLQVIAVAFIAFLIIDLYSWRGLRHLLKKQPARRIRIIKYVFFSLSVLALLSVATILFIAELADYKILRAVLTTTMVCIIGAKGTFMAFVVAEDIIHTIRWAVAKIRGKKKQMVPVPVEETGRDDKPETISRAKFLYQTGLVVATAPVYFFTRGAIKDAHNYRVHYIKLPSPKIPDAFNGLKIVQISDIHSGSFIDKDSVYKGVKLVINEKPDVFFFTGDMVNVMANEMNEFLEVFAPINAPMGCYSTLGNHDYGDYYQGWKDDAEKAQNLQALYNHHKALNWQLLRNEHVVLDREGQKLGVIGVENWGSKARFPKYGDLEKAKAGMPETAYNILLSHDPSHWEAQVLPNHPDIDLTLAGHTHGMQFGIENRFIKFSPAQWIYKQWAGLYSYKNQHIYVNRGYGYLGYPGRVGILPEITVIELVKA